MARFVTRHGAHRAGPTCGRYARQARWARFAARARKTAPSGFHAILRLTTGEGTPLLWRYGPTCRARIERLDGRQVVEIAPVW